MVTSCSLWRMSLAFSEKTEQEQSQSQTLPRRTADTYRWRSVQLHPGEEAGVNKPGDELRWEVGKAGEGKMGVKPLIKS